MAFAPRSLRVFRLRVDDFLFAFAIAATERTEEGRTVVAENAILGTRSLVTNLETLAKLPIAKSKGKTLASSTAYGRKVGRALSKEGFVYHRATQILGVDTARGGVHTGLAWRCDSGARLRRWRGLRTSSGEEGASYTLVEP